MSFFIEDLKTQLKSDLEHLKTTFPTVYTYSDELLNNMYIGWEPTDGNSYIVMNDVGEYREDVWTSYRYTVNTKIVIKDTENLGLNEFSYQCKGIADKLFQMINRKLTNFKIANIVRYDYNPVRLPNMQWQCEILCDFYVDTLTIPGDLTQEYFEEVD